MVKTTSIEMNARKYNKNWDILFTNRGNYVSYDRDLLRFTQTSASLVKVCIGVWIVGVFTVGITKDIQQVIQVWSVGIFVCLFIRSLW